MAETTVELDETPTLGPCCNCSSEENVTGVVMLGLTGPVAGQGWGCVVCGLPPDGAIAVLCERCIAIADAKAAAGDGGHHLVTNICVGWPGLGVRMPRAEWQPQAQPHEHDLAKHEQADRELLERPLRSCRVCGCTEVTACLDGLEPCHWVEHDLCSSCQECDHG